MVECEIPLKLPSLNDYISECRANKFSGAQMKRHTELAISWFLRPLPIFENPVRIHFTWIEKNEKRDIDNVAFSKKFILDAMVKCGKLQDDNRKCVVGFTDDFQIGEKYAVILRIEEV